MIWLLALNFVELMLGSRDGALFSYEFNGFRITLRMALFALTLVVWIAFKRKIWPLPRSIAPWIALWLLVLLGVILGLFWSNSPRAIFDDANAYAFTLLILPILTLEKEEAQRLRSLLERIFPALGLVIAIVTIFLALVFSYGFAEQGGWLYRFVRDLRIGELTPVLPNFTRVFIQSQLWLLTVWFMVVGRSRTTKNYLFASVISTALMLSLSRSFWIGWIAGIIALVATGFPPERLSKRAGSRRSPLWRRNPKVAATVIITGIGLCIILFPSFLYALIGRGNTSEPAASTRQAQLQPLWSKITQHPVLSTGFGSPVTYHSDDPRINGDITTTVFEWGYLDQWLDMGIVGLLAIFFLIFWLIKKTRATLWLAPTLVAVATTHITSPYLNHPLGIGILLLAAVYLPNAREKSL